MLSVFALAVAGMSAIIWTAIILLPSRPFRYREIFFCDKKSSKELPEITVIIPARNEQKSLGRTLLSLLEQDYPNLRVILVDDQSTDDTRKVAEIAGKNFGDKLTIVEGKPLESGWVGKMWALSQGVTKSESEWLLFTDADIYYPQNMISTLVERATAEKRRMFSLMARLSTDNFWEKLLVPAFLYFFKLMYPFAKVNDDRKKTAAAAGGCVLIRKDALTAIGGIECIKDALIDDIALAKAMKANKYSIALEVSPQLLSLRCYHRLKELWQMVARSAFTELKYSYFRLFFCMIIMFITFIAPIIGFFSLFLFSAKYALPILLLSLWAYSSMCCSYYPSIRYFKISKLWSFFLPAIGLLYMGMTMDSALRYTFGVRSSWKGRNYRK